MSAGVTVIDRDTTAGAAAAVGTDTAFIAGLAERGPVGVAVERRSKAQFEAVFGGEFAAGYLWDAARLFPLEGGGAQFYSRCVGPAAKAASAKLNNAEETPKETLVVTAASAYGDTDPGAWGNDIDVKVTTGSEGTFILTVLYQEEVVQTSPELADNTAAVAWAEGSPYIRLADKGKGDPAAPQEVSLTGGTDDRENITDEHRAAALAAFTRDLGSGQVAYPGATTKAMRVALAEHAKANNRIVVPDAADTHVVATLTAASAELASTDDEILGCSFKPFGPWVTVDDESGVTKVLPPSILVMAAIARHDRETYDSVIGVNNPNDPAAGINGVLRRATGLSQDAWTDADRTTVEEGINVIRVVNGQVLIYGYETLADASEHPALRWGNNRRVDMAILARAAAIGEEYVFAQIDARGQKLGEFASALAGEVLSRYWQIGALFGDTAADAFSVNVSEAVNPPEDVAEGKIRALIGAKRSPAAKQVIIEYVKEEVA